MRHSELELTEVKNLTDMRDSSLPAILRDRQFLATNDKTYVMLNKVKHLLRFWRSFILVPRIQDDVKEMSFPFLENTNFKNST